MDEPSVFFECDVCDYISYHLTECRRHYTETKHVMRKVSKNNESLLYYCNECSYVCSKQSDYAKHIATDKHNNPNADKPKSHPCGKCSKTYATASGLWKHSRKCEKPTDPQVNPIESIIVQLLKDNQEFKQLIIDQNKQLIELASKSTTTNNITNNGFNLNVFLNDLCKDALNMSEFVKKLTVNISDLERTGKLGFIEGISGIILRGLRELDVYKRPIHCNDLKRETLYVKENDKWEKEQDNNPKLISVIQSVSNQNIIRLNQWVEENPDCVEPTSSKNDDYLYMFRNSMGGATEEEEDLNIQKVMKNIIKEVVIDKEVAIKQIHNAT
jgi:hypothetical protein